MHIIDIIRYLHTEIVINYIVSIWLLLQLDLMIEDGEMAMASQMCRSQPMEHTVLQYCNVLSSLSVKQYELQGVSQFCLVFFAILGAKW